MIYSRNKSDTSPQLYFYRKTWYYSRIDKRDEQIKVKSAVVTDADAAAPKRPRNTDLQTDRYYNSNFRFWHNFDLPFCFVHIDSKQISPRNARCKDVGRQTRRDTCANWNNTFSWVTKILFVRKSGWDVSRNMKRILFLRRVGGFVCKWKIRRWLVMKKLSTKRKAIASY